MQATLVMFKADGERRDFPVNKDTVVVGRKNTCDLRIPLSSVSRQHFQIELRDDALVMRDLGSSNGTYHNDERKMEVELAAGDKIRVGPVTFVVVIEGQPAEIEPITTVLPADTGEIESPGESAAAQEAVSEAPAEAAEPVEEFEELEEVEVIDDDKIVKPVDEESYTPTVDIDEDDPIAALEALAAAGGDDEDAIPLLDDDEDEDTK